MIPDHYLHVYDKPAQGNAFLARKIAYQYRHQITAMGWFDTASCNVTATRTESEYALENWIGNRVAIYVDNPAEATWEGLISRVTINVGGATFTRSLDNMFNKTVVTKVYNSTSTTNPVPNTAASNTASQAIYGIKDGSIDGYTQNNITGNTGHSDALRDTLLEFNAWPQTSVNVRGGGAANIISLEMIGFYHTLDWERYYSTTTTSRTSYNMITIALLPSLSNGTTFFDNTDFTEIDNTALGWNRSQTQKKGSSFWQMLQIYTEPGDGTNRWIVGITPTNQIGARRLYFRQASSSIDYTARADQGLRVFNAYGKYVPPWRVLPDAGIRINDVLTAWNGQGDDPRETYIESVQYDAESQAVYWQGVDDITVEGAFQLRRYYKTVGTRFGAHPRQAGS